MKRQRMGRRGRKPGDGVLKEIEPQGSALTNAMKLAFGRTAELQKWCGHGALFIGRVKTLQKGKGIWAKIALRRRNPFKLRMRNFCPAKRAKTWRRFGTCKTGRLLGPG